MTQGGALSVPCAPCLVCTRVLVSGMHVVGKYSFKTVQIPPHISRLVKFRRFFRFLSDQACILLYTAVYSYTRTRTCILCQISLPSLPLDIKERAASSSQSAVSCKELISMKHIGMKFCGRDGGWREGQGCTRWTDHL